MELELKKREEKIRRQEEKKEAKKREKEELRAKNREERGEQSIRNRELEKIRDAGEGFSTRIVNITRLCGIIHQSVCKEAAEKISVTRADQQLVKGSIMELQKEVSGVMLKQVELLEENVKLRDKNVKVTPKRVAPIRESKGMEGERANVEMERMEVREKRSERKGKRASRVEREIEEEEYDSTSSFEEVRSRRKPRSYMDVSKGVNVSTKSMNEQREKKEGEKIQGRVVVAGSSEWKTPPPATKEGENTLIVSSQTLSDPNRLIQTLVKSIPAKEIGGAPAVVRPARDGKVIIVPRDKEQQEKIKQQIGTIRNVEVREARKLEPLVVISGVDKGMAEREFVEQMARGMGDGMKGSVNDITIVRRMECRNPWKENISVRMCLENFKNVVKRGRVELGCMLYYAEEYLDLAMCFRCCRFGHIAKHCREDETCHKCGGEHDGRECRRERVKCINCLRMYGNVRDHGARDANCPALREMLERSRNTSRME